MHHERYFWGFEYLYFSIVNEFEDFDAENSGTLEAKEIKNWLERHGKYVSLLQANQIINLMDFDYDGKIEYHDFLGRVFQLKFD